MQYANRVLAVMLCNAALVNTDELDVPGALAKLENWKTEFTQGELLQCADTIRDQSASGDRLVWARLKAVVQNEQLPTIVRGEAFRVAWEKADNKIGLEIISLLTSWTSELESSAETAERLIRDKSLGAKLSLLYAFLAEGRKRVQEVIEDQGPLLDLLTIISTRTACSSEAEYLAIRGIAESPAPRDLRRALAMQLISSYRGRTNINPLLVGLLDSSCFPQLRNLLRQSRETGPFHFQAAAVLAQLGDKDILPDLERLRAGLDERTGSTIDWHIWQIKVQNPPTNLLKYIAGPDEPGHRDDRAWAVQRAQELGLEASEIREAILTRARNASTLKERASLPRLKRVGLELKILKDTDLPDVKIPKLQAEE